MSALAPSAFRVTQAGLNAISVAQSAQSRISITAFSLGAAAGYTPTLADTALHGLEVFPKTPPSSFVRVTSTSIDVVCVVPATAGPFLYGEIGLFLEDGTLFALAAYPEIQSKVTSAVNGIANSITFHAILDVGTATSVVQVLVAAPGVASELPSTNFVSGPTFIPGTPGAVIVREPLWGNTTLFLTRQTAVQWNIHDVAFLVFGTVTALSGDFRTLTIPALNGKVAGAPTGAYLVQDALGNVRVVQSAVGDDLTLTFPMPSGTQAGAIVSVYVLVAYSTFILSNNTGDQVASTVPSSPVGNIAATNVQAALQELDSEKVTKDVTLGATTNLDTLVTSGFYRLLTGTTNGPPSVNVDNTAIIVSRGGDRVSQQITTASGRMFVRAGNPTQAGGAGTWGTWVELATAGAGGVTGVNTGDQVAATVPFSPAGDLAATNVQAALQELDVEKVAKGVHLAPGTDLDTVIISGFYTTPTSLINGPAGASAQSQLVVSRGAGGVATITQLFNDWQTNRTYTRAGSPAIIGGAGSWSAWRELLRVVDLPAQQVASTVPSSPVGNIAATNVQAALQELDSEKAPKASPTFTGTVSGITAAMIASTASGTVASLTVQGAIAELADEKVDKNTTTVVGPDLNTVTASGFYRVLGTPTNGPSGFSDYSLLVINSQDIVTQVAYPRGAQGTRMFSRYLLGTWTGWSESVSVVSQVAGPTGWRVFSDGKVEQWGLTGAFGSNQSLVVGLTIPLLVGVEFVAVSNRTATNESVMWESDTLTTITVRRLGHGSGSGPGQVSYRVWGR